MDNHTDPNANIYSTLGAAPAYIIETADHMQRRALAEEHRVRRACAQVALLQRLPPDAATSVQLVLLQMEADIQTERHERDAEWFKTTLKAHQAGLQSGRADGYSEALTDGQVVLAETPDVTH